MNEEREYLTVGEAQAVLGTSHGKMAKMLATGELPFEVYELDRRIRLIKRADVERLAAGSQKLQRARAARVSTVAAPQTVAAPPEADGINSIAVGARQEQSEVESAPTSVKRRRGKGRARPAGWTGLHLTDRVVYMFLATLQNEHGITPPVSQSLLARVCGISKRQVQISTDRLAEKDYIVKLHDDRRHPDFSKRGMIYQLLQRPSFPQPLS